MHPRRCRATGWRWRWALQKADTNQGGFGAGRVPSSLPQPAVCTTHAGALRHEDINERTSAGARTNNDTDRRRPSHTHPGPGRVPGRVHAQTLNPHPCAILVQQPQPVSHHKRGVLARANHHQAAGTGRGGWGTANNGRPACPRTGRGPLARGGALGTLLHNHGCLLPAAPHVINAPAAPPEHRGLHRARSHTVAPQGLRPHGYWCDWRWRLQLQHRQGPLRLQVARTQTEQTPTLTVVAWECWAAPAGNRGCGRRPPSPSPPVTPAVSSLNNALATDKHSWPHRTGRTGHA